MARRISSQQAQLQRPRSAAHMLTVSRQLPEAGPHTRKRGHNRALHISLASNAFMQWLLRACAEQLPLTGLCSSPIATAI